MADQEDPLDFEHAHSPPLDDDDAANEMDFLDQIAGDLLAAADHMDHIPRGLRSNRRFRALSDTYKKDAEVIVDNFSTGLSARTKNAEMLQTMKQLALLVQEAFEEALGLHRDPADDVLSSRESESPKIHFLMEKISKIFDDSVDDDLIKALCVSYLCDSENDPDIQYYAAVIVYAVVQSLSASDTEDAEIMRLFFEHDEIFFPCMQMMSFEPPSSQAVRLPTRNASEIRALLFGIYGTCFERVVIDEFRTKLGPVRNLVSGCFRRLREYLTAFQPLFPAINEAESHEEPGPSTPSTSKAPQNTNTDNAAQIFQTPPPVPKSGSKRRLERSRSHVGADLSTPSSSAPRRKKLKSNQNSAVSDIRNIDETSSTSSWAEYERLQMGEVSQNFRVLPMDENLEVRLTLDFLVGLATLPDDFGSGFYEQDGLRLCYEFLDYRKRINVRILGQVISLLANLLTNHRFTSKFFETPTRLTQLLKIPYPSIPSVFVVKVMMNIVQSSEYALETIIKNPGEASYPSFLVTQATIYMVEAGLKSGHESARKWAAKFFAKALQYRQFMEVFDQEGTEGLRQLLNLLTHYEYFWKKKGELERELATDEQLVAATEALTAVFQALLTYFTTDMIMKAEWFRSGKRGISHNKAFTQDKEGLDNIREYMLINMPLCRATRGWLGRVARFAEYGGINRLLAILEIVDVDWITLRDFGITPYHKLCLEILEKCVLAQKAQDVIIAYKSQPIAPGNIESTISGIGLLLRLSREGHTADIQKSALQVIANCVYGLRTGKTDAEVEFAAQKKGMGRPFWNDAGHFEMLVGLLRRYRGMRNVLRILNPKVTDEDDPVPPADLPGLRALACKVLAGIARSAPCRQIFQQLSYIRGGELQVLIQRDKSISVNPVDNAKFEKYATELLEIVFEIKLKSPIPVNLVDYVAKQDIVKRTRITFASQEIDLLLLAHLESRELKNTAECLIDEVGLKRVAVQNAPNSDRTERRNRLSISPGIVRGQTGILSSPSSASSATMTNGFKVPHTPKSLPPVPLASTQKNEILDATDAPTTVNGLPNLVGIVANSFRAQHAECEHPIALCPPFSLQKKHRCAPPSNLLRPPADVCMRMHSRLGRYDGHLYGRNLDRHHIFSKFKHVSNIEFPSADPAAFDPADGMLSVSFLGAMQKDIVMGGSEGYVVGYNLRDLTKPTFSRSCHDICETYHLKALGSDQRNTFLSCCTETSSMWRFNGESDCALLKQYENTHYLDMPHWRSNTGIGLQLEDSFLLDLETGIRTLTFQNNGLSGHYSRNRPSFHPSDDLVTHDGLIFDARNGQLIHKFDQFERESSNGIFHTNGNTIIIDSEVWDVRNFKLLKSVSALHKSHMMFNASGHIIYAMPFIEDEELDQINSQYKGQVLTIDAFDYSTIATWDLKKKFTAMATDCLDNHIAFAEQYNETHWSYGRLFQIGIDKTDQEREEEGEEDEDDYHDEDDDDENDSDIYGGDSGDDYDDMYGGEEDDWMDGPDEEDDEGDDGEEEENDYSGYVSLSDEWTDEEGPGEGAAEENNL